MLRVTVVFVLNDWLTPPEQKPRKLFSTISGTTLPSYQFGQNTQAAWRILPVLQTRFAHECFCPNRLKSITGKKKPRRNTAQNARKAGNQALACELRPNIQRS
jgi:hypothetical protein